MYRLTLPRRGVTVAALAVSAVLLLIAIGVQSAYAAGVTAGNPATNRATTDTFSNFTIIDTNNPVGTNGTLNTFTYYAANTNPFQFVVVDAANVVQYVSPTITPSGTGVQTFNAVVPVLAGWNLGVHFDSTGTIPFDSGGAPATYTANGSGMPVVGNTLVAAGTDNRTYSWNASHGTTLIVDDNLACPGAMYSTIQAAVNDANPGETIQVCAGTYPEHVALNKSLTLEGPNMGTPGNGSRSGEAIVDGTDTGTPFAITANDVTVDGFTVQNGSNGGYFSGIWSQTGTENLNILNNIIKGNGFGVWAQCGDNCMIQDNLFDGNNKPGPGSASISADSTDGLTIDNNEFKNDTAGNPILLQAVAAGAHTNVVVSNNNFHDNTNSNIYAVGVDGANIEDNTITPASDATGISLSGADENISITKNVITGGARGVRVEDAGYNLGANSAITINNNDLSSDSQYGIGNTDAAITNLDGTCNWWGAANGPGPVGPGSGSPVTTNVNYSTWLTSDDLDGECDGAPPANVTVTIIKYVEGVHATNANANNQSFPMQSSWNAQNIGAGSGTYSLAPSTYEAQTTSMSNGASYSTNEDTSGNSVGATCAAGKPYALVGYSSGDSEALAAAQTPSPNSPALTNITTNKYVIVWNDDCAIAPPAPDSVSVTIVKYVDGQHATANNAGTSTFPFIAHYNATVNNGGPISGSSPYDISAVGNNTPNSYEAKTLEFEPGANYGTHEVTSGNTVGANCEAGKPYALQGYSWGDSLASAASSTATTTAPSFTNLQSNKYVIVWNENCAEEPQEPGMVTVTIHKFINGMMASSTASSTPSFSMSSTWNAANIGAGTGTYTLSSTGYNSPNAYEAITSDMTAGADYMTNETLGTNVGASCAEGKPYALSGYKTGDSFAGAASSTATTTAPAFTNIQNNKHVIVWNVTCPNGSIGGDVEGDQGVLAVTSIDAVDTSATADNTYANGWEYLFHITVPTNEPGIAMKFSDWTAGSSTIPVANNMRISSLQAASTSTVTVLAANTYTIPNLNMVTDLNPSMPGIQVQVKVEVKIPVGTSNGSYTTNYGVKSE